MNLPALADHNHDGIALTGEQDTIPDPFADAPQIDTLRARFDEARDLLSQSRTDSQKDRDYYDGPKQLDSDIRRILELRKQPPIYTNRIRPAINGVLGVLESGRSDPRGFPRTPEDEESATVGTKTLRYIADTSNFDQTELDVAENFLIEGTGAVIIELDDNEQIVATQVRWEEYYHDPYARRPDLKDARYQGIAKWKDLAQVREKYKVRINDIGDPMMGRGSWLDSFEDRPADRAWIDRKRQRVMVVEEYAVINGQWHRLVYCASGVLEFGVSPWLDDKRRPICPIEAVSCYIDRDNKRYGIVRDMLPIQDEINARRSRALHLANTRSIQQVDPMAPPVDKELAREEASKADGVIPPGWQKVPPDGQLQDNAALLVDAKGEIERMGPTPAVLSRAEGANQSGRSRLVAQNAGLTELSRPLGRLKDWRLRVYQQFWWRAQQFWTGQMYIRVTDDPRAPEFLKVNEPVMGMVMQPMQSPDGLVIQVPSVGVVRVENRLAEIGMDIILDETQDTATLQEEVFANIIELMRGGLDIFSPQGEFVIEMSPLQDKGRLVEKLQKFREKMAQEQQQAAQVQQAAMEVEMAGKQADIAKTQAQTEQISVDTLTTAFSAGQSSVANYATPEA